MADANMPDPTDLLPDVAGVKSRVSWPAIIGGAMTALACYLVLTLLLAAIGITIADQGGRVEQPSIPITIAVVITIATSLFMGGWVSSQLTAGENRQEAVIYGILTWSVVTAFSLYLVSAGVSAGYFGLLGGATIAKKSNAAPTTDDLADLAKRMGYDQAKIDDIKKNAPEKIKAAVNDPANQEAASEAAVKTAWGALVGVMLSMAAAVGGALTGVGTQFRLFPVASNGMRTGTVTATRTI